MSINLNEVLSMSNQRALQKIITLNEGVRNFPYRDTRGILTIGIGHNLEANGLSNAVIQQVFIEDVQQTINDLFNALPWLPNLDQIRLIPLIDLCFNLGINGLLQFHHFLNAVQNQQWTTAYQELLNSEAYKQEPNRIMRNAHIIEMGVLN